MPWCVLLHQPKQEKLSWSTHTEDKKWAKAFLQLYNLVAQWETIFHVQIICSVFNIHCRVNRNTLVSFHCCNADFFIRYQVQNALITSAFFFLISPNHQYEYTPVFPVYFPRCRQGELVEWSIATNFKLVIISYIFVTLLHNLGVMLWGDMWFDML